MAKIGIIQVRGLGDCVMILPMAKWFHDAGNEVFFAIDEVYQECFQEAAPYCTFVPIPRNVFNPEHGIASDYWYEYPYVELQKLGCEHILSFPQGECFFLEKLYNTLPIPVREKLLKRFTNLPERMARETKAYKHLKLDEFKYHVAQVPLRLKWQLSLQRNYERELALFKKLVDPNKRTIVCHLECGGGLRFTKELISYDTATTQLIEITPDVTPNIFDWLSIIEHASTLVLIDSVFFNLVEQLNLPNKKFYIRRGLPTSTVVFGNAWEFAKVDIPETDALY